MERRLRPSQHGPIDEVVHIVHMVNHRGGVRSVSYLVRPMLNYYYYYYIVNTACSPTPPPSLLVRVQTDFSYDL